jgi:phosphatidate phosphatase APP1
MSSSTSKRNHLNKTAITVAHRTETGVCDWLARRAASRGWTPAVIPYSGYASTGHARVLGRVVLAPSSVEPSARRDVSGWRRLLTLESPGVEVAITIGCSTITVTSNKAGIIDARIPLEEPLEPGMTSARLKVDGREELPANVHVMSDDPVLGVVCDIDDTAWVTGIAHPLRAARRTLGGTSSTRESVPGMARLLRTAVEGEGHHAVMYLSNGPWNFVGPVRRFLERGDFPAGAVLMTDWGITPTRWFRDGFEHKSSSLARFMADFPHVTWVLVGDTGEHDPQLYKDVAKAHPDRVAAIALRQVQPQKQAAREAGTRYVNGVPILRGADGDELLPLLKEALRKRS